MVSESSSRRTCTILRDEISISTRSMSTAVGWSGLRTTIRSTASRCSRRMGRSWCSRRIGMRRCRARRMCSLLTGSSDEFHTKAQRRTQRHKESRFSFVSLCLHFVPLCERRTADMNSKRLSILLANLLLLAYAVVAQQTALEPGASRLQQDVSYLASDALDGRRTGTAGANDAARYIAGEFLRAGLVPGINATGTEKRRQMMARYLQSFPYVSGVSVGGNNMLMIHLNDAFNSYEVGKDWMPLAISANSTQQLLPAILVGYGITAPELNYNDYANPKVAGRIAVALSGTPDGDNPHGQFARYEDVRWKAIAARNAGAKALIVVARQENLADDRLSVLHYDNAGDVGIPVIGVSQKVARDLYGNNSFSDMEQATKSKSELAYREVPWEIRLAAGVIRNEVPAYNVIGVLEGSDPVLKNENIIIGAHYDHLGRGGDGSLAPQSAEIHHGADDNASGTAGLIELARISSAQKPKLKRTLIFIAFSGEEEGLLGSNYYVNHPLAPLTNTVGMINMDMIGRMKDRKLIIGGVGTAKEWRGIIEPDKTFELTLNEDGFGPSDHSSFNVSSKV